MQIPYRSLNTDRRMPVSVSPTPSVTTVVGNYGSMHGRKRRGTSSPNDGGAKHDDKLFNVLLVIAALLLAVLFASFWTRHSTGNKNFTQHATNKSFPIQQNFSSPLISFAKVSENNQSKSDCRLNSPLFLSPYIKSNRIKRAQQLARVVDLPGNYRNYITYSGFITVNESDFSNTFFWLFETTNKTLKDLHSAPLLLYLDGGPGISSLDSMFSENGPLGIDASGKLYYLNTTWSDMADVMYVDNPVGTGFSFTSSDAGYSRNQVQIGWNLYNFLVQFYQLFPTYLTRPLYLTGESYAGKYVPALAYRIHEQNKLANSTFKAPLVGIAIGGSWSDPENMYEAYGSLLYNLGTIHHADMHFVNNYTANVKKLIQDGKFIDAFLADDRFISGEFPENQPTIFQNLTGSQNRHNALRSTVDPDYYPSYLERCDVRNALHVGNLTYTTDNNVLYMLRADVCDTVRHWLPTVYENYRTLIYTGQFDIIVGVPLVERFLSVLTEWRDREAYLKAPPLQWRIHPDDREIAGYVKHVGSQFYHAVVRGAGHLVAQDTPERCVDLLRRFVYNETF